MLMMVVEELLLEWSSCLLMSLPRAFLFGKMVDPTKYGLGEATAAGVEYWLGETGVWNRAVNHNKRICIGIPR